MAKSYEQKVILFRRETTDGVGPDPTGPLNAIKVLNYTPTFLTVEQKVRAVDVPYLGAKPVLLSAPQRGASWEIEMAGGGTAVTPTAWARVLESCGFGVPNAGASSVTSTYNPNTSQSFSHWAAFQDEQDSAFSGLMKTIGGRASVGFRIVDDEFPVFTFNYLGRPPAGAWWEEGPMPVPTYTGQADPDLASSENTTFSLDGYALPLRSIEMNANNDLQYRSLIGPADYTTIRQRSWSGTILAEMPRIAAKDYVAKAKASATMAMQIVHGVTAGRIVQIDAPKVQITGDIALSEEQGKVMVSLPVTCLPNNGNDEVVFTSK